MFCSVIIPTIGRQTLSRAVQSVLEQEFTPEEFEVIIVNDSGDANSLPAWREIDRVRIIHTQRRERCMARNAGAAIARGSYLWFLDDDDRILPGAINEFWSLAADSPQADWLYGGIQVVDEYETILAERNSGLRGKSFAQIMGGAWLPIQSSIIKTTAFFEVGGFDPAIIGTEDLDLCRRIAMYGEVANTEAAVACLFRGDLWATSTNYVRAPADTRRSRDALLDEPRAYARLHSSTRGDYWHGRNVRVYLSTINWNLQQGKYLKAAGRALLTGAAAVQSGRAIFSRQFWAGLRAEHVPGSLHFIMKDLENAGRQ
ncbi:MAG: glycosyltransferase family A protein [Candidatus Promineifilaceae bacterium]